MDYEKERMFMKATKFLAFLMAVLTLVSVFSACGGSQPTGETRAEDETQGTFPIETEAETVVEDDLGDINFADVENPTVTFFVRTDYEGEVYAEEVINEDFNDAIYWRNQTIKDRLGVDIGVIAQECGWSTYSQWNQTLRNAVQSSVHDFDGAMIYAGTGSSLATEGCYMDLTELDMISLEKPWWNQNLLKEATIYGSLYFASGAIARSQLTTAAVLWFNKDMYEQYIGNPADVYQVVRDGEWTIDYLCDMTANIWEDIDANGERNSGDTVGWSCSANGSTGIMDAWVYALGCNLTKIDPSIGEPVACFYDEHTVQAYEKLLNLYLHNEGAFVNYDSKGTTGMTSFYRNNVLINTGSLGGGATFRDVPFSYGLLPLPKYDVTQENYRTVPEATSSLVTILSNVPIDRIDMVAATVELMAAESYKTVVPALIDIVFKSKQSDSPDDSEMVQVVLDSLVYSFGWIFSSTHMGDMGKAFRIVDGSRDITQYYLNRQSAYETALNDLIDAFATIA